MQRPTSNRKLAVVYGRVSSAEQAKEGFSIPAQLKLLTGYAGREGIQVVEEFLDVETAKVPGRPGFNEMVQFLTGEAKKPDRGSRCRIILVEKPTAFTAT